MIFLCLIFIAQNAIHFCVYNIFLPINSLFLDRQHCWNLPNLIEGYLYLDEQMHIICIFHPSANIVDVNSYIKYLYLVQLRLFNDIFYA